MSLIALLLIAGTILILTEIFIVPGLSIAGIVGFLFVMGACYLIGRDHGALTAIASFVGVMTIVSLAFFAYIRSPASKRFVLKTTLKARTFDESKLKAGDLGRALTDLRPTGKVQFGDEILEALTEGEFIESGAELVIIRSEGSKIFVKRKGLENV